MRNEKSLLNFNQAEVALVLDCLDFDILIIDKDFKIVFANKCFLEKIKEKKGIVLGGYCYEITHKIKHPCQPPGDTCPITEVVKTGQAMAVNHTHFDSKGRPFTVFVIAASIHESHGDPLFLHISLLQKNVSNKEDEMTAALDKTEDVLRIVNLYLKQMNDIEIKTAELEKTKQELEIKVGTLEKFNSLIVGRELKMIELKRKLKEMEKKLS